MTTDFLALADYRRRVSELYEEVRAADGQPGWGLWRAGRDRLASEHSQGVFFGRSDDRSAGFAYFDYDPSYRTLGTLEPAEAVAVDAPRSGGGGMAFTTVGTLRFALLGAEHALQLMWLDAYGGGLFLPFRDATSGTSTYGGGRYLLDGAKAADLGAVGERLILDFNFSYHPSCAHEPRWSCPLAPPDNALGIAVAAGERFRD